MIAPGVVPGASAASPRARARGRAVGAAAAAAAVVVPDCLGTTTKFAATRLGRGFLVEGREVSRRVLRLVLQDAAAEALPAGHRVGVCWRRRVPGAEGVRVMYSAATSSAHYGALMVCGNIWACPVCAARVAERRAPEIASAIALHQAAGGRVLFLTLTVRHHRWDALRPLLDGFLGVLRGWKSHRTVKRALAAAGCVGDVRSVEVTHGLNGWHPHAHALLFVDVAASLEDLREQLRDQWVRALERAGLTASMEHGLDLVEVGGEDGLTVAGYVVGQAHDAGERFRWSAADELVRGNAKQARSGGRTPFAILADFALDGCLQSRDLFREYVAAFKRRHQLQWSRGLREALGLAGPSHTDEQLAAATVREARLLGVLDVLQWRRVLRDRTARGELLEVAAGGEWAAVLAFVDALRVESPAAKRRTPSGPKLSG